MGTLADEMHPVIAMDLLRMHYWLDGALAAIEDRVHFGLEPAVIRDGDDGITLDDVAVPTRTAWSAPETIADGVVTYLSNAFSIGLLMRALLAGRRHVVLERIVAECTDPDPAARWPIIELRNELRMQLAQPAFDGRLEARRPFVASDPREASLVDALRADPRDTDTREVYADWLEEHGFMSRAAFLRDEPGGEPEPEDLGWRSIVSRAPIASCKAPACPKQWDRLEPIGFDNLRECRTCWQTKAVHYCATADEARLHGIRDGACASDAALPPAEAWRAYNRGNQLIIEHELRENYQPYPVVGSNPPPPHKRRPEPEPEPPVEDEPRGVLSRMVGWFRR